MNFEPEERPELPRSIPFLLDARMQAGDLPLLQSMKREIATSPIKVNLQRVQLTDDPAIHWFAHEALQKDGVPPCLRGNKRNERPQLLYQCWLADVLWLTQKHTGHDTSYSRWRNIFVLENTAASRAQWHKVCIWIYLSGRTPGYYHSNGLGLTDSMMQPLVTMRSNASLRNSMTLRRLPELRELILAEAAKQPADKAGRWTADQIADRRVQLLRVFLLAGKNRTLAAEYHRILTGEVISRQALTKQLEATRAATKMRKLLS